MPDRHFFKTYTDKIHTSYDIFIKFTTLVSSSYKIVLIIQIKKK